MTLRRVTAIVTSSFGLCALSFVIAPAAHAESICDSKGKVGCMTAGYYPVSHPNHPRTYRGLSRAQLPGQCVHVERKSGTGWTQVEFGWEYCSTTGIHQWSIQSPLAVSATQAIRLRVATGSNVGSFVNICNTKTQCLAMRLAG